MSATSRRLLISSAIVAALGYAAWTLNRETPLQLNFATVEQGTVEQTIANTRAGTIKACRRAGLSPSAGGQIAQLPIREGDSVKQGQLLLALWNEDLRAQLALTEQEAQSAAASAVAKCVEADRAARESVRLQSLLKRQLVAADQVDLAISAARASAAACEAAQASAAVSRTRIELVRAQLERTELHAPFDGVVAQINGELSEFVTPSPIGIATPPAVDLIGRDCFYLSAPIDEVDVAHVSVGQPARITLDAFGQQAFAGSVQRVADFVLDVEKQARTVDVEVRFSEQADTTALLAGYSADVEIIVQRAPEALRIPTEALVDGDQVFVWQRSDGRLHKRSVKTGISNWDHTQIIEGLSAGDWVVTSIDREGVADGALAEAPPNPVTTSAKAHAQ